MTEENELPAYDAAFKQLAKNIEETLFIRDEVTRVTSLRQLYDNLLIKAGAPLIPGKYQGDKLKRAPCRSLQRPSWIPYCVLETNWHVCILLCNSTRCADRTAQNSPCRHWKHNISAVTKSILPCTSKASICLFSIMQRIYCKMLLRAVAFHLPGPPTANDVQPSGFQISVPPLLFNVHLWIAAGKLKFGMEVS